MNKVSVLGKNALRNCFVKEARHPRTITFDERTVKAEPQSISKYPV